MRDESSRVAQVVLRAQRQGQVEELRADGIAKRDTSVALIRAGRESDAARAADAHRIRGRRDTVGVEHVDAELDRGVERDHRRRAIEGNAGARTESERRRTVGQIGDGRIRRCHRNSGRVQRPGRRTVRAARERGVRHLEERAGVVARGRATEGSRRRREDRCDRIPERLADVGVVAGAAGGKKQRRIRRHEEVVWNEAPDVARGRAGEVARSEIVAVRDPRRERDDADLRVGEVRSCRGTIGEGCEAGRVGRCAQGPHRGQEEIRSEPHRFRGRLLAEVRCGRAFRVVRGHRRSERTARRQEYRAGCAGRGRIGSGVVGSQHIRHLKRRGARHERAGAAANASRQIGMPGRVLHGDLQRAGVLVLRGDHRLTVRKGDGLRRGTRLRGRDRRGIDRHLSGAGARIDVGRPESERLRTGIGFDHAALGVGRRRAVGREVQREVAARDLRRAEGGNDGRRRIRERRRSHRESAGGPGQRSFRVVIVQRRIARLVDADVDRARAFAIAQGKGRRRLPGRPGVSRNAVIRDRVGKGAAACNE